MINNLKSKLFFLTLIAAILGYISIQYGQGQFFSFDVANIASVTTFTPCVGQRFHIRSWLNDKIVMDQCTTIIKLVKNDGKILEIHTHIEGVENSKPFDNNYIWKNRSLDLMKDMANVEGATYNPYIINGKAIPSLSVQSPTVTATFAIDPDHANLAFPGMLYYRSYNKSHEMVLTRLVSIEDPK